MSQVHHSFYPDTLFCLFDSNPIYCTAHIPACSFVNNQYLMFMILTDTKKSKWPFSRRSTVGVLFFSYCCVWLMLGQWWWCLWLVFGVLCLAVGLDIVLWPTSQSRLMWFFLSLLAHSFCNWSRHEMQNLSLILEGHLNKITNPQTYSFPLINKHP